MVPIRLSALLPNVEHRNLGTANINLPSAREKRSAFEEDQKLIFSDNTVTKGGLNGRLLLYLLRYKSIVSFTQRITIDSRPLLKWLLL